jgi:hypothetical protein
LQKQAHLLVSWLWKGYQIKYYDSSSNSNSKSVSAEATLDFTEWRAIWPLHRRR